MTGKQRSTPGTTARPTRPTIATIAAQMGLSASTVTHVLNGRAAAQRIHPATQDRVLKVARELGYRPNASARAVRDGRFGNIALVQSLLGQYLPNELLCGLSEAIADKDMHLVLTQVPELVIDEESYLTHAMRALSVDGVLINRHVGLSAAYLERIRRLAIPAISLNVRQEDDCIHPDEVMGGGMAVGFLLGLGHERIAFVDTDDPENGHFSKEDRRAGYAQAMAAAGLTPRVHLLPLAWQLPGQPGRDPRVDAARALLADPARPTAVVAYEMTEAMATVHAATEMGLRIPEDLSVVVFHHWFDERFYRPFHTVLNAMRDVGAGAVSMLLEKIADPEVRLPARAVPVTMLEGATCLPPPRSSRRDMP